MAAVKQLALIPYKGLRKTWPVIFFLVTLATLVPLLSFAAGERYWPGFFYAPFYTNNVFSDPTVPAAAAGLKPEDRVIGLNGVRIEFLRAITARQGQAGGNVSLVYELGRELAAISVPVERQSWERLFDKWAVFGLGGLGLAAWGWRKRQRLAQIFSLVLIASGDYWLNPGAERLSGFDPAAFVTSGEWGFASAKWSTYFYWPLWLALWGIAGWELIERLQVRRRTLIFLKKVLGTFALAELAIYSYEAIRTARFNNPDYITFHIRTIWWPGWAPVFVLATLVCFRQKRWPCWLGLGGLIVGVAGFGAAVFYAVELPGPGPQWYALGLVVTVWAWSYLDRAVRPRSNSPG